MNFWQNTEYFFSSSPFLFLLFVIFLSFFLFLVFLYLSSHYCVHSLSLSRIHEQFVALKNIRKCNFFFVRLLKNPDQFVIIKKISWTVHSSSVKGVELFDFIYSIRTNIDLTVVCTATATFSLFYIIIHTLFR